MVDVSVVIPCRNGSITIESQLSAILRQDADVSFEVVVADNGSTDATEVLVERMSSQDSRVRVVDASERPGINVARNVGVRASLGNFVLLCDADDVVNPGWLAAYAQAIANGARCVGGGLDRVLEDGTLVSRERQLYTLYWDRPWAVGANCGFAREVFDELGGFDEDLAGGGDETDFFWRAYEAGYELRLVADAVVSYRVRDSLPAVFAQFFQYGQGQVRLFAKFEARGMPRSGLAIAGVRLAYALIRIGTSRGGSLRRRRGVEALGVQCGRALGSIRQRTYYV